MRMDDLWYNWFRFFFLLYLLDLCLCHLRSFSSIQPESSSFVSESIGEVNVQVLDESLEHSSYSSPRLYDLWFDVHLLLGRRRRSRSDADGVVGRSRRFMGGSVGSRRGVGGIVARFLDRVLLEGYSSNLARIGLERFESLREFVDSGLASGRHRGVIDDSLFGR